MVSTDYPEGRCVLYIDRRYNASITTVTASMLGFIITEELKPHHLNIVRY